MADKKEGKLKIFIHGTTGTVIAAREISRKDGIILVKHPAFTQMRGDKSGFHFEPFSYVTREFNLYREGCLGDTDMPEIMVPFFEKYEVRQEALTEELPDKEGLLTAAAQPAKS
jgi:hypothetical protein